jgi:hypothetical protein
MSEDDSTSVVACTLTEEGERARAERVRSVLASNFVGAEERADGYTLRFDGTDETLTSVARFVADELQCCSFAEYTIEVSPPYEETRLTIGGPEGTKAMFREGLLARLEAAQS